MYTRLPFLVTLGFILLMIPESATANTVTEAEIRDYFADTPAMIEIARCESGFRQFSDSGSVLRGGSGGGMIGAFQFFESIHTTPAKRLNLNLATLEGNMAYAKHLYQSEGTTPWNSAKNCWDTKQVSKTVSLYSGELAELKQRVALLTQLLELLTRLQAKQA